MWDFGNILALFFSFWLHLSTTLVTFYSSMVISSAVTSGQRSFSDTDPSVVCVDVCLCVNICFKRLLLRNRQSDLLQILYRCSSNGSLPSLLKLWWCLHFWIFYEFLKFFLKQTSKIFFSKTTKPMVTKFYQDVPWGHLYQVCSNCGEFYIFGFLMNFFSFLSKNFKNHVKNLLQNYKAYSHQIWPGCSLGGPLPSLFKLWWILHFWIFYEFF